MRASHRYRIFEQADQRHAWVRAVRDAIAWMIYAFAALVGIGAFGLACYCDDPSGIDETMALFGVGLVVVALFVLACFLIGGLRPAPVVGLFLSLLLMAGLASWGLPEPAALSVLAAEHIGVVGWCIVRRPTTRCS